MKALSVYQPWATLIAIGAKRFETRPWLTHHRGPLAIQAGLKKPPTSWDLRGPVVEAVVEALGGDAWEDLPRGAIVGIVKVVRCDETSRAIRHIGVSYHDQLFGDWTPGRYAWQLTNNYAFIKPIECLGRQRLFNLPADIETQVGCVWSKR